MNEASKIGLRKPLEVAVTEKDCWEVVSHATDQKGYPRIWRDGKQYRAHKWMWEQFHNNSVPSGMFVCHRCDNPGCINPAHLFVGTAFDNNYDSIRKGRRGRLNAHKVRAIRQEYACKHTFYYLLAEKYGVGQSTIRDAINRITWKHI